MMKWFGPAYGAPYEADCPHVDTPVGTPCEWCGELLQGPDSGVLIPLVGGGVQTQLPYHYECHLRQITGGLNHLRGNCLCCGGTEPSDPPWLTRRQAAQQAVAVWQRQRT